MEASLPKPTFQDHKSCHTSHSYKGIHGKVEKEKSHDERGGAEQTNLHRVMYVR